MSEIREQGESEMEDQPGAGQEEAPPPEAEESSQMREELEEALREKDQFRAMAMRAQADLANFKRRAAEERQEARRTANSDMILKVLSVLDDLERALALIPEDAVAEGWLDGLRLVKRNIDHVLESEGVSRIEAEGKPFAPWEHEAVTFEEAADREDDTVVRVVREGYRLRDRVLRAAQVVVSRAPVSDGESEADDQEA